jgi:hypothetical protein
VLTNDGKSMQQKKETPFVDDNLQIVKWSYLTLLVPGVYSSSVPFF